MNEYLIISFSRTRTYFLDKFYRKMCVYTPNKFRFTWRGRRERDRDRHGATETKLENKTETETQGRGGNKKRETHVHIEGERWTDRWRDMKDGGGEREQDWGPPERNGLGGS